MHFTAGILIRRQIRKQLERAQFHGVDFRFHESKGLLSSEFTLRGEEDKMQPVLNYLREVERAMA
jgi:hypothetical protein